MLQWGHPPDTAIPEAKRDIILGRLAAVLDRWRGTPYMHGQCYVGAGVDCVRFVVAVLDELFAVDGDPIPVLPGDTSWHDPAGARRVLRLVAKRYAYTRAGEIVEPGDVAILDRPDGTPQHIVIVGPRPHTIWHADRGVGVVEAGLGRVKTARAWRVLDKTAWV